MLRLDKQMRQEEQHLRDLLGIQPEDSPQECDLGALFRSIDDRMFRADGRVNWFYVIMNLGKLVARIALARRAAMNG